MRIDVTARVTVQNPKLQSVTTHKSDATYLRSQIVGVLRLPKPQDDGPLTQIITTVGPVDVYEDYETILKKVDA